MGRHPNPTKLAILNGTFRLDQNGITPTAKGRPEKPSGLGRYGGPLWDSVIDHVVSIGAGACDTETLAGMCRWYEDYRTLRNATVRLGVMHKQHKRLAYTTAMAWREFVSLASKFCLTPVDRAKMKLEAKDSGGDEEQRFFG